MKIKLPKGYTLSKPYNELSSPFGRVVESLNRKTWYLTRPYKKSDTSLNEFLVELWKKEGRNIGNIQKFDNEKSRYIIPQTYPQISFNTMQKTVNYLIKNEGKIVYCS